MLLNSVEEEATDEFNTLTTLLIFSTDDADLTCLGMLSLSELIVVEDVGDFRGKGGNRSVGNSNGGSPCAITTSE